MKPPSRFAFFLALVVFTAATAPGCASVLTAVGSEWTPPLEPYSGTRWDVAMIAETGADEPTPSTVAVVGLVSMDFPLSAILDTALLPVSLPLWLARRARTSPAIVRPRGVAASRVEPSDAVEREGR